MIQTVNIIYCGMQLTRTSKQIPESSARCLTHAAEQRAAEVFGGYSHSLIEGGWIDQKPGQADHVVRERSMRWEIVTEGQDGDVEAFAEYLRILFDQDTVIVSAYEVKTRYITRSRETGSSLAA